MQTNWVSRATLFEVLSYAFLYTTEETVAVLVDGEYKEALAEALDANGFDEKLKDRATESLSAYEGADKTELLHQLRTEYTRLFIGAPKPAVSPYAGTWYAESINVDPLLFVNKESMFAERFFARCGIGRPEGTNEPLDHIATELEFLNYLCMVRAGVVELPEGVEIPEDAYEEFYNEHFAWSKEFASQVLEATSEPLFLAAAEVLKVLPERA